MFVHRMIILKGLVSKNIGKKGEKNYGVENKNI
jgi:hypothetical protein